MEGLTVSAGVQDKWLLESDNRPGFFLKITKSTIIWLPSNYWGK